MIVACSMRLIGKLNLHIPDRSSMPIL